MNLCRPDKDLRVSIIICFYERIGYLKCCLDSLVPSAMLFDEVIIADDGSSSETVSEIEALMDQYPFSIKHAWYPKEGFRAAAARNNGVRHAAGNYLIFFDCDFLILQDTVKIHLERAKRGRFLSGYCKYLSEETTNQIFKRGVSDLDLGKIYKDIPEENLKRDHRKFLSRTLRIRLHLASHRKQTLGGHFSIYRKDFESVNGYDEKFVGWGAEDIDLGIRLVAKGIYGRSVIRSAKVLHMWHHREARSENWETASNIEYFNRKYINPICKSGLMKLP